MWSSTDIGRGYRSGAVWDKEKFHELERPFEPTTNYLAWHPTWRRPMAAPPRVMSPQQRRRRERRQRREPEYQGLQWGAQTAREMSPQHGHAVWNEPGQQRLGDDTVLDWRPRTVREEVQHT